MATRLFALAVSWFRLKLHQLSSVCTSDRFDSAVYAMSRKNWHNNCYMANIKRIYTSWFSVVATLITSGQSNLTQGRIAAAHGRFSRILQVAPLCTPYIESQKLLPWQHPLEPRNRLCLHQIAWPRKPTPRIKQRVASYHTTKVIVHRKAKRGCHGDVP